jgi:hypothetical protein
VKHYKAFLFGVLVTVLAFTLFWAGTAYATTGCFPDTNGHWAETFICWLKENGIASGYPDGRFGPEDPVRRSEMAVMLQRASNIPPATGQILISAGMNSWDSAFPPGTTGISFLRHPIVLTAERSTIGAELIGVTPDMPVALYGKSLQFVGVEFCYKASANAVLAQIGVLTVLATTSVGDNDDLFLDNTDRTDEACRYYVLPAPVTLQTEHAGVSFYAVIDWTVASADFQLSRTTFVFQPTDVTAADPAMLSDPEVTILQEGTADQDGGSAIGP